MAFDPTKLSQVAISLLPTTNIKVVRWLYVDTTEPLSTLMHDDFWDGAFPSIREGDAFQITGSDGSKAGFFLYVQNGPPDLVPHPWWTF